MRRAVETPPIPSDPGLPGARGLFTGQGVRALAEFLADRGWAMEEARPVQAMYRPGRSCVVRYRVRATGSAGARALMISAETRARERATTLPSGASEQGRFGVADPVARVDPYLVWSFPFDPSLPDLPDAAWGPHVRERLAAVGDRPAAVSVQALRYRPRRRAVFRYRILRRGKDGRRWETAFGKVLPRSKVEQALVAAHRIRRRKHRLQLSLPVALLGEQALVFEPAAGLSLRELLVRGEALPSPARVAGLPDALAAEVEATGVIREVERPVPLDVARFAIGLIERLTPEVASDARRVLDAVARGSAEDDMHVRPVHGDLYEAQVFVDRDFSFGLIDLDDLGPGDPAADAANFCAHLLALALSVPAAGGRLVAYRTLVRRAFLARLGLAPAALAWREALAMLLLATGPFRVLDPRWPGEVARRVRLAARLLEEEV